MKYWFINFEEEQYWIEVADDNIAMRQIIKNADDIIQISCIEDCLAEGVIDVEDLEGEIIEISLEKFEEKWNAEIKAYLNLWKLQKKNIQLARL